eukprot:gene5852-4202_t
MMLQEENEDSAADRVLIDVTAKGKPGLLRRYRHENRRNFEELLNKRVSGWTPATMAVFYRFQPCLEYIAECGADLLLSRNPADHTPLIVACLRGDLAMVRYLVCEAYVDVNQCSTTRNGFSPLMAACQIGHIEVVTLLLSNGADIHHRGENARTAIFYAALSGCVHCVRALLLRGVDVNLLDHRGHSPLLATLFFADHAAVVALLLRGGAHVNLVDRDEWAAKEATRRLQQTERRARQTKVDESSASVSAVFGYECRIA